MLRNRDHLAEDYFNGKFRYSASIAQYISEDRFDAVQQQFSLQYDDFYHPYFKKYGAALNSNKALIRVNFNLFRSTYGHLPLAYKNCAISSGIWAHLDAVARNHYTTDRLSRVVGSDWHGRTIKDNSQRSLERIERVKDLFNEVFFIAPTMYEGSTRVFSHNKGRELTSLPFQAEEYMAFWNMVIDCCEAFVLDDVRLDMPDIHQVEMEIDLAKKYSSQSRNRPLLRTSDWANSRNSIYEMARGNYIRFGMHPLRPDAKMDLRLYDEASDKLFPARLIDTLKPVLQNIIRWGPQGIAVDSACITAARLIELHRRRTDSVHNARQIAPLELDKLSPLVAKPSQQENKEFEKVIAGFEPVLLKYFSHLLNPNGLPYEYQMAHDAHPIQAGDIGEASVKWQRDHIPKNEMLDLWELTLPSEYKPSKAFKPRPISHGTYIPKRRLHDFDKQPFTVDPQEIWPDNPFEKLDPMFQQLARAHMGVLEIVAQNSGAPEFQGVLRDLKRGDAALDKTTEIGLADIALLPGALGRDFIKQVRDVNLAKAIEELEDAKRMVIGRKEMAVPAFGTAILSEVSQVINRERQFLNGPGPHTTPSDYRLAIAMEMLRRNLTSQKLSKNWETSEDETRLMMLLTKMEFGKVERPAGNNTEIKVLNEDGEIIPFADRVNRIYTYLSRLKHVERIKRSISVRDPDVIEQYGVRHISLTLAKMLEIYDCLKDQDYNGNRFELRRVENLREFSSGLDNISFIRELAMKEIEEEWCWLWSESDLEGLRSEYRDAWLATNGMQARIAGVNPNQDIGIRQNFSPR